MPLDRPFREGLGEEIGKVLLNPLGTGRVRDSWDQDGREEAGGVVDVEVGTWAGDAAKGIVREGGIGQDGRQKGGDQDEEHHMAHDGHSMGGGGSAPNEQQELVQSSPSQCDEVSKSEGLLLASGGRDVWGASRLACAHHHLPV